VEVVEGKLQMVVEDRLQMGEEGRMKLVVEDRLRLVVEGRLRLVEEGRLRLVVEDRLRLVVEGRLHQEEVVVGTLKWVVVGKMKQEVEGVGSQMVVGRLQQKGGRLEQLLVDSWLVHKNGCLIFHQSRTTIYLRLFQSSIQFHLTAYVHCNWFLVRMGQCTLVVHHLWK
jgi:hypothetical protein